MRVRLVPCGLVVAVVVAVAACAPATVEDVLVDEIAFESVDLPGRLWDPFLPALDDGAPVTVTGSLSIPPTDEPVPAVIMTHGCGGVWGSEVGWVEELNDLGFATLIVDSFGGRGITEICTGQETINVASPIVDIYRAAETLDRHRWVDGSRLAIVGFSFGGRAAIWTAFTRFKETYEGREFAGHIAFYPSTCFIELADESVSSGPIRIFHGTDDDWTPIDQCEAMVERMAADGTDIRLLAYPGAEHSFDNREVGWAERHLVLEGVSPRNCTFAEIDGAIIDLDTRDIGGIGSTCIERGVSYGYDAQARKDAATDLAAFLTDILRP
jgi:dienelactone hydrolase